MLTAPSSLKLSVWPSKLFLLLLNSLLLFVSVCTSINNSNNDSLHPDIRDPSLARAPRIAHHFGSDVIVQKRVRNNETTLDVLKNNSHYGTQEPFKSSQEKETQNAAKVMIARIDNNTAENRNVLSESTAENQSRRKKRSEGDNLGPSDTLVTNTIAWKNITFKHPVIKNEKSRRRKSNKKRNRQRKNKRGQKRRRNWGFPPKYMIDIYHAFSGGSPVANVVRGFTHVNKDILLSGGEINTRIHQLIFNLTSMPHQEHVTSAELRLYTMVTRDRRLYWGIDRTVSVYLIESASNETPKKELIVRRFIQAGRFGWETFNVTTAVLHWVEDLSESQVLEVRVEATAGSGRDVGTEEATGRSSGRDRISWSLRRLGIDTRPNREPLLVVYSDEPQEEKVAGRLEDEVRNHELDMIRDDVIDDNNGLGAQRQVRRYLQVRGGYTGGGGVEEGEGGGGGGGGGGSGDGGRRHHKNNRRKNKNHGSSSNSLRMRRRTLQKEAINSTITDGLFNLTQRYPHYKNMGLEGNSSYQILARRGRKRGISGVEYGDIEDGGIFKRRKRRLSGQEGARGHRRTKRGKSRRKGRKFKPCRKAPMSVNFIDINWHTWVLAPKGYDAYSCEGRCDFPISDHLTPTTHAIVQSLVHINFPGKAARACCVPTKLKPISLLYVDEGIVTFKYRYQDMVVGECGCR